MSAHFVCIGGDAVAPQGVERLWLGVDIQLDVIGRRLWDWRRDQWLSLTSSAFKATAGTALNFDFNYVTSDGTGSQGLFSDYAFANLLNATTGKTVVVLFDARTEPSGTIAPGVGMPVPVATLTPASVPIIGGGPSWSPLGTAMRLA